MRYFTSDLHLFHDNILIYCKRPFDTVQEMWSTIKRNWNKTVKPEDEVWVLGDLTLKADAFKTPLTKMVHDLNGTKHFVVAPTHDLFRPREYEEIGFTTIHYPAFKLDNGWMLAHDPATAVALPEGAVLIHGHVHGLWTTRKTDTGISLVNVGVDVHNFYPVSETRIQELLETMK